MGLGHQQLPARSVALLKMPKVGSSQ
jgi:hypothetical protein